MLDFLKWLITPLWLKKYLQDDPIENPPVITTELTDSDDNVVISQVIPEVDTTPIDELVDTTPIDELWKECDDIVSNMGWKEDVECIDLDTFIQELNNNAEYSMKQRDQLKNYVIDDIFNTPVIKVHDPVIRKSENSVIIAPAIEPPKKQKKRKKKRNLRYNLRNS